MIKQLAERYLDLCVSEGVSEAANQSLNWDLLKGLYAWMWMQSPWFWVLGAF